MQYSAEQKIGLELSLEMSDDLNIFINKKIKKCEEKNLDRKLTMQMIASALGGHISLLFGNFDVKLTEILLENIKDQANQIRLKLKKDNQK